MAADAGETENVLSASIASSGIAESHDNFVKRSTKGTRIEEACRARDLDLLVQLAAQGDGFLTDALRRKAWPILLGSGAISSNAHEKEMSWQDLPAHRDEEQVKLDVNRSFTHYPSNQTEKQLNGRRVELEALIVETLRRHPSLCYFQGYHDIVQVFLLVQGAEAASPLVQRLSMLRIRDFMLPKISASVSHLHLLPAILYNADREIYDILPSNPFYGIAHILTLYSHDIHSYKDIARLFDFLLAREAVMTIYLFAVIVISKRETLLEYMADGPDEDVMAVVLQRLPENLDIEDKIQKAAALFEQFPPQRLPGKAWKQVSEYSVLKTTLDVHAVSQQALEDGQRLFEKHAEQIRKDEARKRMSDMAKKTLAKYRRPLTFTLSVAVCIIAVWCGQDRNTAFGGVLQRVGRFVAFVRHWDQ